MIRRLSGKSQQINDENINHANKTKSVSQPVQSQQQSARIRKVLGVVPDSALNSHSLQQQQLNPVSNAIQVDQNLIQQQSIKTRIPVLADKHTVSSIRSTSEDCFDDVMETSNIIDDDYENQHQFAEVDEEEEDEDDEEEETSHYFYNEPMSPILTNDIKQEIDRVYKKYSKNYLDPEDEDTYDVTMVAEYGNSIFNYLHELEIKYKPDPKYVEHIQEDLSWEHRATLMDWLVQLHSRFNLLPETLFLAVNIIDRFLSNKAISLSRFQLCGAVALFIAAKYEEINVPTVSQMTYMVGNQYSRESFLRAERFMVEVLGFEFGWPGPMSFLRRGSKADDYDNEVRTLAKYFLELTIMDSRFVSSPPSWLAAGAQFLSRKMLGRGNWTETHVYYTGYTTEQLVPLAEVLEECCLNYKTHHKTIFEKYSERRFKRSSVYVQEYLRTYYSHSD